MKVKNIFVVNIFTAFCLIAFCLIGWIFLNLAQSQSGKTATRQQDHYWQEVVDTFNGNFERLRVLTCAGPIPHKYVTGDFLTNDNLSANFAVIIKALEKGGCK